MCNFLMMQVQKYAFNRDLTAFSSGRMEDIFVTSDSWKERVDERRDKNNIRGTSGIKK